MISLDIQKTLSAANGEMVLSVQMEVNKGEFVALYGPSGVGKTSTLRMLSGLMKPDGGCIKVGNELWFDAKQKINRRPQDRQIGFVFQDYALFPNMTVRQNLEFALKKNQSAKTVADLIDFTELGDLQSRRPATLSGGQKQRVALARALVQKPKILLLDEALSALDVTIRTKLQDYLRKVHQEFNLTTILISHDIGEIMKLSDRVIVMENGIVSASGSPDEIFIKKQDTNGKFRLSGEILKIAPSEGGGHEVIVEIQSNFVKIEMTEDDGAKNFQVGERVVVFMEDFQTSLQKM